MSALLRLMPMLIQGSGVSRSGPSGGALSGSFSGDRVRSTRRKGLDGVEPLPRSGRVPGPERGRAQRRLSSCPGTLPVGETRGYGGKAPTLQNFSLSASELKRELKPNSADRRIRGLCLDLSASFGDRQDRNPAAPRSGFSLLNCHRKIEVDETCVNRSSLINPQKHKVLLFPGGFILSSSHGEHSGSLRVLLCIELKGSIRNLLKCFSNKILDSQHRRVSIERCLYLGRVQ